MVLFPTQAGASAGETASGYDPLLQKVLYDLPDLGLETFRGKPPGALPQMMAQVLLLYAALKDGLNLIHCVGFIIENQGGMINDLNLPSAIGNKYDTPGVDHLPDSNSKGFVLPAMNSIAMG